MGKWRDRFHKLAFEAETRVGHVKHRVKRPFLRDGLMVFPYLGYGTPEELYLKGRVLEDKGISDPEDDTSLWKNLVDAYKRFDSDETPNARVRVSFRGQSQDLLTDDEGYFDVHLQLETPLENPDYLQELEFELLSPLPTKQTGTHFTGTVIVPPERAEFGIISDMDDTVLQTGATSLLSMAKKTLFGNARTRLPFEGVSAFYAALHRDTNPLFYVSSSPWNLYDLLVDFLDVNEIPLGPLMLRDWGISETEFFASSHGEHKLGAIENIFETYPKLPFILIGDSGQEDPEIYREVVHNHPDRVLCIYIRDVSDEAARDEEVQKLAAELEQDRSELVLVPDTVTAAHHAAERGWISPYWVEEVKEKKAEDEAQPVL